jgi:tRNA pseudouridine32 synthase/23S rRNA pseudouridine746 synthase
VTPPLQLHHLDDDLLVVDKPAGLLAVPGRGEDKQDCLSARVQKIYPDALVVHRLDMATSGLMLMARNPNAQRVLSLAFAERRVHKRYTAVVHGVMTSPLNTLADADGWRLIALPIAVDWPNRPLRVINHDSGKPSQTRWRIDSYSGQDPQTQTTRLQLEPLTGRSHQLRVHLQALGHPIVGDALYGPLPDPSLRANSPSLRAQRGNPSPSTADMDCRAALAMTQNAALAMTQNAALAMTQNAALAMTQNAALAMTAGFESRLRLHASALAFDHPVTGLKLRFDSLVPF